MGIKDRRINLLKSLPDKSLLILSAGKEITQSEDSNFPFFVNRNFFYLTNISQANSILVIVKTNEVKEYLFIDQYDEKKEKWFGKKLTHDEAKELSKIDEIHSLTNFNNEIREIIKTISNVYLDFKVDNTYLNEVRKSFPNLKINNVYPLIVDLRMIKDESEINDIKEAIKITHLGLMRVIKELKTAYNEMEIYNAFNHEILNHGTHEIGFPSIIATGVHTCCLHYPTPTDNIDRSGLILCDVGAAYNHYSSDVTRTYPISGKFNDLQKKIYQIVLNTNRQVIETIKPGVMLKDLQEVAKKTLIAGCLEAGLVAKAEELEKYYFHNVSHHLGLDTHDASNKDKPLAPGMIITVEPGLYFKEHKIGVRIEDDVLVTSNGHEVLSKDIAKNIEDIEKLFIGGNL